jgi:hypothetical protein
MRHAVNSAVNFYNAGVATRDRRIASRNIRRHPSTFFRQQFCLKWAKNCSAARGDGSDRNSHQELTKEKLGCDQGDRGPMLWFLNLFSTKNSAKKLAFLTQNKAKFWKKLIITLVFKKNATFFAENWEKSQKIVIITSTPDWAHFRLKTW